MGARLSIAATPLAGVVSVATARLQDERGSFARLFCGDELGEVLQGRTIAQVNQTRTRVVGTVRGLHFQRAPHAEMKFVRCVRGRVWDVALDLRAGSPTFWHWHAQELSADNALMLVLPEGCAHGFQCLEPDSELLYLHTAAFAPGAEGGVHCQEARAGIRWPLPVTGLSPRDASFPPLPPDFAGLDS